MEKHEHVHKSMKNLVVNNFIGGLAWGLGLTIGLSIVLALLGLVANSVGVVPIVGNFASDVISYIEKTRGF